MKSFELNIYKQILYNLITFTRWKVAVIAVLFLLCLNTFAGADTYLRVSAVNNDSRDTVGRVEHFVQYGIKISVFIPPYTAHFIIYPLAESLYSVEIGFYELGPGYSHRHERLSAVPGRPYTIEDLPSKGILFDYSFTISNDTADLFQLVPTDSLTNFESTHFTAYIWRHSYADYKFDMRSGYNEYIFDRFRKELDVTRAGKIDLYILPGSNNSPSIDNYTGVGYDIAGGSLYTVFNSDFDSALPQYTQRFVIYDTWGYSARLFVVGFSRYFFDDIYVARKLVSEMTFSELEGILTGEYPEDIEYADILSGAVVKFLIDNYGMSNFKKLYEKSAPGKFMFDDIYDMSFDELLKRFIDYENNLALDESNASYFSDLYSGQMWFDKTLDYRTWLASQPLRRDYHLRKLGVTHFFLGNYAKSESCYTILAEKQPDNKQIAYLTGLAYIHRGMTDKAIRKLESIVDDFPEAAKMLTNIYLDWQQYTKAREAFSKSKVIADSWSALLEARLNLADDNPARADTMLNAALAFSGNVISSVPGEARGYIDAAYASMFMVSYQDAETELKIALFVENRPYYLALVYLAMGRLYDLKGDRQSAKTFYGQAVELNSGEYINALANNYIESPFKLK